MCPSARGAALDAEPRRLPGRARHSLVWASSGIVPKSHVNATTQRQFPAPQPCGVYNFLYNVRDMNLEQVARRAKVSTATVSRVLNNASVVKTSTRARVVKAIEELKYHPNLHARNLAGGKSRTIGMIVSNMENPFFFDIYKTVES